MNQAKNTIQNLLTEWGRQQRQIPYNNETLKSEILGRFQPALPKMAPRFQRTSWLTIAFSGLTVISLFISYLPGKQLMRPAVEPLVGVGTESGEKSDLNLMREYYLPYQGSGTEVPITDVREFLKTDYNAAIRTRKVEELVYRIRTDVRTVFDGRVDGSSSSKRSGYVSFAVPANRFEDFRWSIKSLVGERFLTENIYTENLLPQKISIEEQRKEVEKTLTQLRLDRGRLNSEHQKTVAPIQSEINKINDELVVLKIKADVTSDPAKREEIRLRIEQLQNEKSALETALASENTSYLKKLNSLDSQIRDNETSLNGIIRQDQKLVDTVATVRGTIYLNWISVWEIIQLYFPKNLFAPLFGVTAVIFYIIHRRRQHLLLPS